MRVKDLKRKLGSCDPEKVVIIECYDRRYQRWRIMKVSAVQANPNGDSLNSVRLMAEVLEVPPRAE